MNRVVAGRIDGDLDVDIVAAALLPNDLAPDTSSVVWFERSADGKFAGRAVDRVGEERSGRFRTASLAVIELPGGHRGLLRGYSRGVSSIEATVFSGD